MKISVGKDVKILSLAFLFIFLGYNSIQQYVTTFFADSGIIDLGFQSLILVYLFFTLSDPLSAVAVSKIGSKRCMVAASFFYSLFIILLLTKSAGLIYLGSSVLGVAASLLWTGQNSYLIRVSGKKVYGRNSGFFYTLLFLGSALGVVAIGFAAPYLQFSLVFLAFSALPLVGLLLLTRIKDVRTEKQANHLKLIKKSITSHTALKLSSIWFVMEFISGLVIGIIPLVIKDVLGVAYIGLLSSVFYVMPIFLSYIFGRTSDIKGRKFMVVVSYALLVAGLLSMSFSGQPLFLVSGILIFSVVLSIITPIRDALAGDVTTKRNLEYFVSLVWMVRNIGVVAALALSQFFKLQTSNLYLISIFVVAASFLIAAPVLRLNIKEIRERISKEVG